LDYPQSGSCIKYNNTISYSIFVSTLRFIFREFVLIVGFKEPFLKAKQNKMNRYFIFILIALFVSCQTKQDKKRSNKLKTAPAGQVSVSADSEEEPHPSDSTIQNNMVYFEGGSFIMGSAEGLPQEQPAHQVVVQAFYIDKTPVTVAEFRKFIETTGFKTEAEKFGDSGVFNFDKQNWELLKGAYWKKPLGPTGPEAKDMHPVTHVSWNDATAYAKWAGKRLPTEAEWEFAARSGTNSGEKFSWGNEISENGKYFANTWQGSLEQPETKDGFLYTSPVDAFAENAAGLTDMGGNVWQWCSDIYKAYPGSQAPIRVDANVKVIRSGSFFYDQYGEDSFSVSGRSGNSHETSLFNTGFRCAKSVP
jgi:sulfatase modifying factor 1